MSLPFAGIAAAVVAAALGNAVVQALPDEPLLPLPPAAPADAAKVALGRQLFHDKRLSHDNQKSCASCHDLSRGGADGQPLARGVGDKVNELNTPTIYNTFLNFHTSWDGRAVSPAARITESIERPTLLASSWPEVIAKLSSDAALLAQYRRSYSAPMSAATLSDALIVYQQTLLTPSRFDRYLRGDATAISADEKAGYAKFKSYGCVACHQGVNVGGNMFQKFGAMQEMHHLDKDADQGRFRLTGRDHDRHVFRVPSLRNVALTAPYFHNGSAATLHDAIDVMFEYQLGRSASPADKAQIEAFLRTLSGERLPPPGAAP